MDNFSPIYINEELTCLRNFRNDVVTVSNMSYCLVYNIFLQFNGISLCSYR